MSAETTPPKTSVSQRIDGLSPEKRRLLEQLLRAQGVDASRLARIPRRKQTGPLPLSFAQQRLWFLDQLEPGNPFYNITAALYLHGALDVSALARSLEEITRRHESLRTIFQTEEGKPSQIVLESSPEVFSVADLRHVAPEARDAAARRLIVEDSQRPFDLARGPLMRASLYKLDEQRHALLLVMHHIVSDAGSMAALVREVAALYEAFSQGRPSPLAPLPIQYADYALWQRDWLAGGALDSQLGYWREQLAGAPPVLELPTDRPRPAVQRFDGAAHHFRLPKELADALNELGRREGTTLFMTLLAAFDALLYRYSNQSDFSVGTPVAGRTRVETEPLVGFFVNTLVLRARLRPEMTFRELLADVKRTALGAYANQDVPFDKLVEELQPERDLSRTPLFQVMFTLQNVSPGILRLPGLRLETLAAEGTTSKFDLELIIAETGSGDLEGLIEYSTELFDATTVERLASHLRVLLAAAAAEPDAQLSRLPLLTQDERRLLLSDWNETAADYPSDKTFNDLFSERAAAAPDAPAVSGPGGSYSYAGLDRLASRVARALSSRGAAPEHVVALLCERTEATVAAVLGVLRSGAAYLPLDPRHPSARHRQVLERSGARLILAGPGLTEAAREAAGEGAEVLDLEVLLAGGDGDGAAPFVPTAPAGPRSLAYVIYTSGSTGAPKGAMVEHRGMLNHLLAKVRDLSLSGSDVVAQTAPLCFDISVWQMLSPLASGGRVEVLPDTEAHDPAALLTAVGARGVSVLELVPSMLRAVNERLEAEGAGAPGRLRWLLATGEALPPAVCRGWLRATGGRVPVVNAYGPTECSDDVTHEFIRQEEEAGGAQVPVGRALQNTRLYVVGSGMEPAPVGVAGELLVGGDGVGRGYLGEAKLTAEKFIPDSFSGEAGARLYRTGDLVKYLADGRVEFLGRLDEQVKVRGHRIELGEIESAVGRHELVKEAVVLVREGAGGEKRLVAYVTAAGGGSEGLVAELRSFLKERLPEYMVPAAFVVLNEMPLTPNGKVNKKALPEPEASRASESERYVAPRSSIEETLAGIWSEVLGLERVGVEENFFELGGDSILSIQIVARAQRAGLRLTPRHLFQAQTVAELAAVAEVSEVSTATGETGDEAGEAPLTPIQRWFFDEVKEDPNHYNQSALLALREPLAPEVVEAALGETVARHGALRARFRRGPEGWLATYGAGVEESLRFTSEDVRGLEGEALSEEIEGRAALMQRELDIERGPLVRAALFETGAGGRQRLLVVAHHLVIDGVSWRVLLEDFEEACGQLSAGSAVELPARTTSFKRWSERLAEYARTDESKAELDYWIEQREALAGAARLPLRDAAGANTQAEAETFETELGEDETRALLTEVPAAYRTQIQEVLLAALARTVGRWTGGERVAVALEGHGREELFAGADLSRTVGWFTSMFPVVLDAGWGGVEETLKTVKEQLRAVPRAGVGYGVLRYMNEEAAASLGRAAGGVEWELGFNYLGQFDQVVGGGASLFEAARESAGPSQSPRQQRPHELEVNAMVAGGRLRVSWTYGRARLGAEEVREVAVRYLDELRAVVEHCAGEGSGGFTPSDFAEFDFSQDELDDIAGAIGKAKGGLR